MKLLLAYSSPQEKTDFLEFAAKLVSVGQDADENTIEKKFLKSLAIACKRTFCTGFSGEAIRFFGVDDSYNNIPDEEELAAKLPEYIVDRIEMLNRFLVKAPYENLPVDPTDPKKNITLEEYTQSLQDQIALQESQYEEAVVMATVAASNVAAAELSGVKELANKVESDVVLKVETAMAAVDTFEQAGGVLKEPGKLGGVLRDPGKIGGVGDIGGVNEDPGIVNLVDIIK